MYILYSIPSTASCHLYVIHVSLATLINNATFMFTYPTLLISYVYTAPYTIYCILLSLCNTCITSHFNKQCHFYVYIPYITYLICIYCTLYHLLHLAYAVKDTLLRNRKPILGLTLDWRCLIWVWKESLQSNQTPRYL